MSGIDPGMDSTGVSPFGATNPHYNVYGSNPGAPDYFDSADFKAKVKNSLSPRKAWADQMNKDWTALTKDPMSLGMSDAEREKLIGEATAQANASQNAQVSQMNQAALGGQGFQAGTFAQGARDVAAQSSDAAAKATVGINQLNQSMIDKEKERIYAEMDAARQRKTETDNFWRGLGIDAVAGLIGFAAGGPAGAAAGVSMVGGAAQQKPDSAGDSAGAAFTGAMTPPPVV